MSQVVSRRVLQSKFPHLVPLFDSLYLDHNKVYFHHANGKLDLIHQYEGYAQGCPLSPCFAPFVLGKFLQELNRDLAKQVKARQTKKDPGDSGTAAFFDDANAPLIYEDIY
eukprot:8957893-Ditylum_brightwellii.AAC.1